MNDKWWGRFGYQDHGITMEREFQTEAEAKAYALGGNDAIEQANNCDDSPLEEAFCVASNEVSHHEDCAEIRRKGPCNCHILYDREEKALKAILNDSHRNLSSKDKE